MLLQGAAAPRSPELRSWVTRTLVNEFYKILRHKQKYILSADEALFCKQIDSCHDYAELLSVPESTIKSRVHRAKKTLLAEWVG